MRLPRHLVVIVYTVIFVLSKLVSSFLSKPFDVALGIFLKIFKETFSILLHYSENFYIKMIFRCGYRISIRGYVHPLVRWSVGPLVGW